jgi:hypothetical protein
MKRKIDDVEGMLDDIAESMLNWSKKELVDSVMDCRYGDKVKNEDIIEEYRNFYGDIEN